MKLKKFTVKKLFGIFDHSISVNNDSGITIIIGENGLGKTVILEMINAFFKSRFYHFSNIAFKEIIFEFDDNIKWKLKKKNKDQEDEKIPSVTLTQTNKNKSEYKPIVLINYEKNDVFMFASRIARTIPGL